MFCLFVLGVFGLFVLFSGVFCLFVLGLGLVLFFFVFVPLALEQGCETCLLRQQGATCCINENTVPNQSDFKYLIHLLHFLLLADMLVLRFSNKLEDIFFSVFTLL